MAALAGCSTIKNTAATAVDLSSTFSGYGASTTVRGGLSEIGSFDSCTPTVIKNTEPLIFGNQTNYNSYLAAKYLMAATEGDQRLTGMWKRKDNGTALLKGEETIKGAKATGWLKPGWRLPWTPPPFTGSTEIRIKHDGGMTYVQVLEKGNDIEFLLAGRADAPRRFKQQIFYTSYYVVNEKGVIFGETWAPEFSGGLKPLNLFIGRTAGDLSDDGLTDQIRGIIARRQHNNINYLVAAANNDRFCNVEPGSTFCRMTADDQNVVGPAIFGDFEKSKKMMESFDPTIIDLVNAKPETTTKEGKPAKPAKKELSW